MVGKTNTADVTVDPAIALGLVVTGYSGDYDKTSHTVTVDVAPEYRSTTSYRYSTNGTSYSTSVPSRTNAGTTTVYVRAINTILGTVTGQTTITINPAPVTLTAGSLSTTYNRYAQSVNSFTSSVSGISFSGVTASGSGTDVGSYKVTFSGVTKDVTTDNTGNYIVRELVEGTITIAKAKASDLGLSVTGYNGMYDGSPHSVTATVYYPSGTTIQYSTDNSTWKSSVTRTAVGTTKVYVRALNDNYNTATGSASIVITEAKATLTVSWPSGQLCSLFDPDDNAVFEYSTSGYWSGTPSKPGTYYAVCSNVSPNVKTVDVTSTTSGTYPIAW